MHSETLPHRHRDIRCLEMKHNVLLILMKLTTAEVTNHSMSKSDWLQRSWRFSCKRKNMWQPIRNHRTSFSLQRTKTPTWFQCDGCHSHPSICLFHCRHYYFLYSPSSFMFVTSHTLTNNIVTNTSMAGTGIF